MKHVLDVGMIAFATSAACAVIEMLFRLVAQ